MPLDTTSRLPLYVRMLGALGLVSIVSLLIVLVATAVTGMVVVSGIGVVAGVVALFTPWDGLFTRLWALSPIALGAVVLLIGASVVPVLYLKPASAEIRAFKRNLRTTGTLAADRHEKIATMGRRLAQQADIPEPEIRIVNRRRPESYALGSRSNGTIVVTRGLIRQLSDDEIEAVLAHEMSHLANGDGRLMSLLLTPMLVGEYVRPDAPPTFQFYNGHGIFVYLARHAYWTVVTAIMTVQLWLCQLGIALFSRGRELAADSGAAELTGSPGALASALETLHGGRGTPSDDLRTFKRSVGVLDILPVEATRRFGGLFATHPNTETRIERLKSMAAGADD